MFVPSLCFVCVFVRFALCLETRQVKTPSGTVEGFLDKTINGRTIYSFEGIPFAEPPVGKYRFKEPIPSKPWEGVWKANIKYECLQYSQMPYPKMDPIVGNEDCLYLNVYTPKIRGAKLDVIAFIHGGAFMFGNGAAFQPNILLDRDVVFVTFNYRVGPLGFLSTEDDVLPGNNGLKDQIMALKWIKDNIEYFGGNPDSITITGISAGGASVHFHTLTTKSRGLFHRAASLSGCMLNPWVLMENPLERTKELASFVGCNTKNTELMVNCLEKRPGRQIVSTVPKFQPWKHNPFAPFGPVVDEWASDPVLPKHPIQLLKERSVIDVPWIVSHTSGEGLFPAFYYYNQDTLKYMDDHWNEIMPHVLHYNVTIEASQMDKISSEIKRKYFGEESITKENFNKLVDVIGDRLFKVDLEKCTRLHAAAVKSPVFHYMFDYRGAHSITDLGTQTRENLGVCHGDDMFYFIKTSFMEPPSTDEDKAISKFMVDSLVTFSKKGKPEGGVNWSEVSKNIHDPVRYLRISQIFSDEASDSLGNNQFWNSLPFKENEKLLAIRDEL